MKSGENGCFESCTGTGFVLCGVFLVGDVVETIKNTCVGAIANRGWWEQGCSLPMATDLGPVSATREKKKTLDTWKTFPGDFMLTVFHHYKDWVWEAGHHGPVCLCTCKNLGVWGFKSHCHQFPFSNLMTVSFNWSIFLKMGSNQI